MARRVTEIRHQELEPLPEAQVVYAPETRTLSIQNGQRVKDGEEIAKGVTAFYDADGSLAAIDLESAELLLKPFLDALQPKRSVRWCHSCEQSFDQDGCYPCDRCGRDTCYRDQQACQSEMDCDYVLCGRCVEAHWEEQHPDEE